MFLGPFPTTDNRKGGAAEAAPGGGFAAAAEAAAALRLDPAPGAPWREAVRRFPMRWPRPYLALAAAAPGGPVWRMGRPEAAELEADAGDLADPVGEGGRSPLPHLVCKHPDRALLLVTRRCHFYCRFCFRRGAGPGGEPRPGELEAALAWIAERPAVREVILSGGDPLTLEDRRLAELLGRLAEIPHVETVRIHTRAPIHYPERVTAGLVAALAQGPPAWLVVHANHPVELTPAVAAALGRLRQAGLPLLDQSVLLRGVNDATATLEALFRALYRLGVRPYYLHHPDRAPGNRSFRLPLAAGLRLVRPLRHRLPGPALPRYVVDLPDGSGKVEVEALTPLDGGRYRWEDPATGRSVTFRDIPEAAASPSGPICR